MASYSCNDNQNYFVKSGRTTSRVLAPPGGASSFSLGVVPAPESTTETTNNDLPKEDSPKAVTEVSGTAETVKPLVSSDPMSSSAVAPCPNTEGDAAPVSSNAFASGANMNGANVMTGRPTSRVLAPPGGHSSFTLG